MKRESISSRQSLMKELGITMKEFRQRMEFMGVHREDIHLLSDMGNLVKSHVDQIVKVVYQRVLDFDRHQATSKNRGEKYPLLFFQKEYILEMFQGKFNEAYVEKRLRIGEMLYSSGLTPKWYLGAQSISENLLSDLISRAYKTAHGKALKRIMAVQKIVFLNATLTLDFYRHRLTTQLKEKIQELDEFTHVVSHDLKEPLRGIEAFSTFLAEDYSPFLDERGKQYLTFLKESAMHMKELINDLLTISSIVRHEPNIQRVKLGKIIAQVLHDLKFTIQQKNAQIKISSITPTLLCDPVQIGQVFQNLISNAIKFNRSNPPQIEIEIEDQDRFYLFAIKDNGIGIDPRYTGRIFELFERLHQKEEFEGTGAGLAISKKIIERFGGSIKVVSRPGKGSNFSFTLPKIVNGKGNDPY